MQIDITRVGEIVQDFNNKQIEIRSAEGYSMWQRKYTSEDAFKRAFREIYKKFSEELTRRSAQIKRECER